MLPWIRSWVPFAWLQVIERAERTPSWVENQPQGFLIKHPVFLLFIPCLHPWTLKRSPHIRTMAFMSGVFQLCACKGCSPPAWWYSGSSGVQPHAPLSSYNWTSTSLRQCLSNLRLSARRTPKLEIWASVRWLQFWKADHGSHGGDTWRYLGRVFLISFRALRKPPTVFKSKPLCKPMDKALPHSQPQLGSTDYPMVRIFPTDPVDPYQQVLGNHQPHESGRFRHHENDPVHQAQNGRVPSQVRHDTHWKQKQKQDHQQHHHHKQKHRWLHYLLLHKISHQKNFHSSLSCQFPNCHVHLRLGGAVPTNLGAHPPVQWPHGPQDSRH